MKVLVLLGSTRAGSFNAKLAALAVAQLPADVQTSEFDITRLPFYDAELDAVAALGEAVADFRAAVAAADAVLMASPAYNGSMSAQVKNAIDTASRPRGAAALLGKPVAVLTAVANPRTGAAVLEHIQLALRIAGARPVERGVLTSIRDLSAGADEPLRAQLAGLVAGLVAAARLDAEPSVA